MKILHVIPTVNILYGGPVQAAIPLCKELINQGIGVAIATSGDRASDSNLDKSLPVYCFLAQFGSFLPSQFYLSGQLGRWLKAHIREFDLLHIHCLFNYPASIACYYANKFRVPYIIRPAGMLSDFCLKKSALKKKIYIFLFENRNFKNAAAIHFASEEEKNSAKKLCLNIREILLPLGLDPGNFKDTAKFKGVFRKSYPFISGKKIILFLSRIHPIKGLNILIPALKMLAKKRNDFIFVISGAGSKSYEKTVKGLLDSNGLTASSVFTGFLEGEMKSAVLADADVFVLPSFHESFGIAVAEAMASGLPVVISNKVNINNLVKDYQSGIVTELNSREISSALDTLLSDGPLRIKMGINGKKLVEENFNIKRVAKQMIEEYSRIIKTGH